MKRTKFSTKSLLIISITLLLISIFSIVALLIFIALINKTTIAYTKGASLLTVYVQAYISVKSDKTIQESTKTEIENKIKGFYIFYEMLTDKNIPPEEIEKAWLEFGMKEDEIRTVIIGTKLLKKTPLIYQIKENTEKVKQKLDNISSLSSEDFEDLLKVLLEFTNSFHKTLEKVTYLAITMASIFFIVVIMVLLGYFLRTYYLISDLRNLTNHLPIIAKSIYREEIKDLDIIDSKSELYPIQESFLTVIEKIKKLREIKENLKNVTEETFKTLEMETLEMQKLITNISHIRSKLSEIDVSSVLNYLETLQQTFSILDSEINEIRSNMEKIRSISTKILEPISTVYEILEESFKQYSLSKEITFKYINETKEIIEAIRISFSRSTEGIGEVLEELKKISLSLRSIGINASIEFSKISSTNEALSNIANKIIELSRNLGTIFGNIRSNLENLETELGHSISKIKAFVESFSEINKNIEEVGTTIQNIRDEKNKNLDQINTAYSLLGEVMNRILTLDHQNEKLLSLFFSFTEKTKKITEVTKTIAEISEELERYSECAEELNKLIKILKDFSREMENL